jgi:alpha-tubulin suppressor-like RCC1 family protein
MNLKNTIFIFFICLHTMLLSNIYAKQLNYDLALGSSHACAIDETGVKCWGSNTFSKSDAPSDLIRPQQVSVGGHTSCVVDDNGLQCWGRQIHGAPEVFTDLMQVVVGRDHICALDDGKVRCWGDNRYGQINVPRNLNKVKGISAGDNHTCVINEDEVKCWGDNDNYQTAIKDGLLKPREISSFEDRTCVIDEKGVKCWGRNYYGRIFSFRTNLVRPKKISLGRTHVCVIDEKKVKCWGDRYSSIVNTYDHFKNPQKVSVGSDNICVLDENGISCWWTNHGQYYPTENLENIEKIAMGDAHGCVVANDNVKCWGDNTYGQLEVPKELSDLKEISAGFRHSCVLTGEDVKCWGDNSYGQSDVPQGLINVKQITAGRRFTCALTGDDVKCWGDSPLSRRISWISTVLDNPQKASAGLTQECIINNDKVECKRLGGGSPYYIREAKVPNTKLNHPTQISAGAFRTCVLDRDGVKCWGEGYSYYGGELQRGLKNPRQVAVGGNQTCAIDDDGLKCWGDRYYGHKVPPYEFKNLTDIAFGKDHSCFIDDGKVQCWGSNKSGQSFIPFPISNPKQVSVGEYHTCVIDEDNVKCWGAGLNNVPNKPYRSNGVVKVASGYRHACAIYSRSFGANLVHCWGNNNRRQLDIPENIRNPKDIFISGNKSCVIDEEGKKCWGDGLDDLVIPSEGVIKVGHFTKCVIESGSLKCSGGELKTKEELEFYTKPLEQIFNTAIPHLSLIRSFFLKDVLHSQVLSPYIVNSFTGEDEIEKSLFLLEIIKPVMLTSDSHIFSTKVSPLISQMENILKNKLNKITGHEYNILFDLEICLEVISLGIESSEKLLTMDSRKKLVSLKRALGKALATKSNNDLLIFLEEYDASRELFKGLRSSPKSSFLIQVIELCVEFLSLDA